jgi:hypothetical protein
VANTPNWQHHSKKLRNAKGCCKGVLKARRQALQALKTKLQTTNKEDKNVHNT